MKQLTWRQAVVLGSIGSLGLIARAPCESGLPETKSAGFELVLDNPKDLPRFAKALGLPSGAGETEVDRVVQALVKQVREELGFQAESVPAFRLRVVESRRELRGLYKGTAAEDHEGLLAMYQPTERLIGVTPATLRPEVLAHEIAHHIVNTSFPMPLPRDVDEAIAYRIQDKFSGWTPPAIEVAMAK